MSTVNGDNDSSGLARGRMSRWRSAALPGAIMAPTRRRLAAVNRARRREYREGLGRTIIQERVGRSYVESEIDDVPVSDRVRLSLEPEEPLRARGREVSRAHEVVV
jgi:hypothetical protein